MAEMRKLDKFEVVARDAQFALVLLCNESTSDFELVEPEPVPTERARSFAERGLSFAGILGVVGGKPAVALALELDAATEGAIVEAFFAHWRKNTRWAVPADTNVN